MVDIMDLFKKLLSDIDHKQKLMFQAAFDHDSIHEYREAIRKLRALLFFFKSNIKSKSFYIADTMTKYYFNLTSLIREIDVFEAGYKQDMSETTQNALKGLKEKTKAEMVQKFQIPIQDGFECFEKLIIEFSHCEVIEALKLTVKQRQIELFNEFLTLEEDRFSEEKYIHNKRMLAKKIVFVYDLLPSCFQNIETLKDTLVDFQLSAKKLHDVCVDLRFIGQFQLEDEKLLNQLVMDYGKTSEVAKSQYQITCTCIRLGIENL